MAQTDSGDQHGERTPADLTFVGRMLNHTSEKGSAAAVTLSTYALYDFMLEKRAALTAWNRLLAQVLVAHIPAADGALCCNAAL